jgi:PAS domain S-box-containing protein
MKIANKISLYFFSVAIILCGIAAPIFYLIVKKDLRNSIYSHLELAADSKAEHVETYLRMLKVTIGQLSKSVVLENFLKAESDREAFSAALDRVKRTKEANSSVFEFLLLNKTGKVIVSSNEENIGLDKSGDAFFIGGQKSPYIKDAYYSETLKEPMIASSAPLLDSKTGELLGVVVARIKMEELNRIVTDATGMGKTGEIYIVNKYGYMITPSRFLKDTFLKQKVDTLNYENCLLHQKDKSLSKEKKHVGIGQDYRGVTVLGTHDYIAEMDWCLLAEVDREEAVLPLLKIRIIFIIILVTVPFIAWLLGAFISHMLMLPLRQLHKGMEIIGEGNLDYKVGTDKKDEVGRLSRAFDKMIDDLKHSTTSIEKLSEEISRRKIVEDRLRTNEAWLSTTLRSIGDGVIATDVSGHIVFINKVSEELTGYNKDEALGKHLREIFNIVNEATGKAADNPIDRVLREGVIAGLANHTVLISKNGMRCPIDDSAAPIRDEKGNIIGAVLVFRDVTERRRREETNQRLAAIVESSDDAIIGKTLDGIIVSWNKGAEKIYGYREDEVKGKHVSLLAPPGLRDETSGLINKILQVGQVEHFETTRLRKDGQLINVSLTISPVYDANGNIIGASAIGRDITERKRMEAKIKESQDMVRAILDQTFQFIGLMTIDGVLIEVNKAATDFIGSDKDAYLNKFFWDTPWWKHSPELQNKLRESIKKVAAGEFVRFEVTHKAKDGSLHYIDFSLKPIKDETGKVVYMIPEGRDITERKMMEEKLAVTAKEWESTFNSISDFVSIQDRDSRLVKVNKAYADLFKMKPQELIGRVCHNVVHGTDEPCFDCPHQKTIVTKKASRLEYFEERFNAYLEVSTSPIFDANNEVVGTVHIVKDITERKKVEEAFREAAKLKSYFTSMVSHELRTPLTAIKESIAIVTDGTAGSLNDEQKDFLEMSKKNVDRLARLINDVLDYQKLESGKQEFNFKENDLNEIIKETQSIMITVAKERGLDIILNLDNDLPRIQCDRDKIIQVLTNLISNAIKFTEDGAITIISEKNNNIVEVKVKDTGIGIKKEDFPRLFRAFEQLEKGNDRKTGSTGLGLVICKEIIERHKGKIWVESEFGQGSVFHVVLPIVERRV